MTMLAPLVRAAELEPRQSSAFLLSGSLEKAEESFALAPEPEAVLSREQRRAVLTSLRDGRGSVIRTGWRTRLARIVFGLSQPASFANDRLEALRRYAILYRLEGAALSLAEDERLLASGLSGGQASAARALVDAHYRPDGGRLRLPWSFVGMVALTAAAAGFLYRWLAAQFDDSAGALVVTILLAAWAVSIAAVTSHPHGRYA